MVDFILSPLLVDYHPLIGLSPLLFFGLLWLRVTFAYISCLSGTNKHTFCRP